MIPKSNRLIDVKSWISENIGSLYEAGENRMIVRILLEDLLGISPAGQMDAEHRLSESEIVTVKKAILRLQRNQPIQYITGKVHFAGMILEVGPGALIPRPETEELVDYVARIAKEGASVLDLCSGSGCIALGVKFNRPDLAVAMLEKSAEAMRIAEINAEKYRLDVTPICTDVFDNNWMDDMGMVDIIASNPPYIPRSEKQKMEVLVVDNEPDMALFVSDDDPLVFYRRIAECGRRLLKESGKLVCEVHENLASEVVNLFFENGFRHTMVIKDMQEKDRIVCAEK